MRLLCWTCPTTPHQVPDQGKRFSTPPHHTWCTGILSSISSTPVQNSVLNECLNTKIKNPSVLLWCFDFCKSNNGIRVTVYSFPFIFPLSDVICVERISSHQQHWRDTRCWRTATRSASCRSHLKDV